MLLEDEDVEDDDFFSLDFEGFRLDCLVVDVFALPTFFRRDPFLIPLAYSCVEVLVLLVRVDMDEDKSK